MLHRLVSFNECQPLTTISQILCVHTSKVDGNIKQSVGNHLFDDTHRVNFRLFSCRLVELCQCCDDDVCECCDGATNHAPFQWKWQHRIRYKQCEENVPHEIFTLCKANSFTDEPCEVEKFKVQQQEIFSSFTS